MTRQELMEARYSVGVLSKARKAFERVITDPQNSPLHFDPETEMYRVEASTPRTPPYRLQYMPGWRAAEGMSVLPWITCSCPNGLNKGGEPTCWHSALVLLATEVEE